MDPPTTSTHTPGSYKAFVMVFMNGGADTFNMIVPMGCDLWGRHWECLGGSALSAHCGGLLEGRGGIGESG